MAGNDWRETLDKLPRPLSLKQLQALVKSGVLSTMSQIELEDIWAGREDWQAKRRKESLERLARQGKETSVERE